MKQNLLKLLLTMIFAIILTTAKAETVSVTLSREGTLAEKVLEQATSLSMVTDLTVSGPINESDWSCITYQLSNLETLNMERASATFSNIATFNQNVTFFVVPNGIKRLVCDMENLSYLELSNTVENLGGSNWYMFQNLHTIKFGSGIKSISYAPFEYCRSLVNVYINDLKSWCGVDIDRAASSPFYNRNSEASSTMHLFIDGEEVTDLSISNVGQINEYVFYGCSAIQNLEITDGCISVGRNTFAYCTNINNIILPSSLTRLEDGVFYGCSSISELNLPSSLHAVGDNAFSNCVSMKTLILSNSITNIGNSAFSNCKSLQEITFPETLQTIGNSAFSGCSGLTKVTSLIPFPIAATNGIFSGIDIENCTLVVPEWSAMLYKMAMGWSEFANIETVKTGDLASMTVTDSRYLPATVRPNGTANVSILPSGSLTVRGETPFPMNEVTLGTSIGEGEWKYGYDDNDNDNYYEYYSPSLAGAVLINDESSLSAQSARIKLESIGGTWGFISFPFDVKLSDITNDPEKEQSNYVFKYYDGERRGLVGTGGNWIEASNILKAGVGYIYQSQDSASIYLKATPETVGNVCNRNNVKTILQEYASEDAEDGNWNFIGNPYPAYFDTHYIDFTAPITVWNGRGYDAVSLTDDEFVLSPYQAFFVQKQNDGNSITFFAEGRLAENRQANSDKRVASRSVAISDNREIYNIYLSDESYTDKCRIVINENSKIGYDASNDAVKFFSDNKSLPQIYSIGEKSVEYSINERPSASGIIELGVRTTNGLYTISSDSEQQIYLIDRMTNETIDLSISDYEFSSDESDGNGRFAIRLVNDMSSVNTVNNSTETRINVAGEILSILCSEIETINVSSLDGVNVAMLNGANNYSIKLSKGIYIVKSNNSVEKVIIR